MHNCHSNAVKSCKMQREAQKKHAIMIWHMYPVSQTAKATTKDNTHTTFTEKTNHLTTGVHQNQSHQPQRSVFSPFHPWQRRAEWVNNVWTKIRLKTAQLIMPQSHSSVFSQHALSQAEKSNKNLYPVKPFMIRNCKMQKVAQTHPKEEAYCCHTISLGGGLVGGLVWWVGG